MSELLRIKDAAKKFPFSESWLRRAIVKKQIPFIRCGGTYFIDEPVFTEFIKSQSVEPKRHLN